MSHVRMEEDLEFIEIPWLDIISVVVVLGLVFLKYKS